MRDETRTFYEIATLAAVERVVASLDEAIDLHALAKRAALSPFHFHRVFRGLVGETPLELHRRLRLERAAERLATTATDVTEIAFHAGYETHEAFTRAFRQHYGRPPIAFRERAADPACHPPTTELAARCGLHVRDGRVDLACLTFAHRGEEPMDVEILSRPALRLATVRHVGPYSDIAAAFHRLGGLAAEHGLYAHVQAPMLALYHDDPESTPPADLRSDAALVVTDEAALPEGITEAHLPAGRYARAVHHGPYAGLGDTWARLMGEWLPRSGHRVGSGPSYEVYVTDPRSTRAEDLITELYVPLAG